MCISYPGRVVAVTAGDAIVETTGRRRHASILLLPDAAIGDWVVVGAGSILRRLDPADAGELIAALDTATARSATARSAARPGAEHTAATPADAEHPAAQRAASGGRP